MTQEQAQGRAMVQVSVGDVVRIQFGTGAGYAVCIGDPGVAKRRDGVLVLSSSAPLAAALLGAAPGETISFTVEGVKKSAVVIEIVRS